ncbi:MAG TPA: cyclic nucleotide-binding domain-containing protein [Syntrophales bacterium]|nr:cyclic nucleotide-binding domain-containing protein [Syntrophales bacterium]
MDKDIATLTEVALFKNLKAEQIGRILDIMHKVTFPANEIIMREGDVGSTMYIIIEGTVEVAKSLVIDDSSDGTSDKNKVFTRLDCGEHAVFGELALLEARKRTASVRAVTDCVMYEMKRDDFLKVADDDYELGFRVMLNLARIVSARLRRADEDTVKLTTALSIMLHEA